MNQATRGLPDERSETVFSDKKEAYTRTQAVAEANRCLYCQDPPCTRICPTHIDIPEFIRKIATGNVKGSAGTIFKSNVFGMSCARVCPVEVLCVGECVFNRMGVAPIQIGKLQRYSTDVAYDAGWRYFEAGPDLGKSVGLVGGGPASLACAHELRRIGYACTIYEKRSHLGGLNTHGIAPYKIRADAALDEVEWVMAIGGIEVVHAAVDIDISWAELLAKHDAVFIGVGLGPDRMMDLPGQNLAGVWGAVEFIEAMKLGKVDLGGVTDAVVVGGGNTAVDAVRESLFLGVERVTLVYRKDEKSMPGYRHEWGAAKQEGARAAWRSLPVALNGVDAVASVRCVRLDDAIKPIAGSETEIPAQLVLLAIGQSKLSDLIARSGVATSGGRVVTDERGRTSKAGIYSGGDCANGAKEVVNAVAEGRHAALAIDADLGGGSHA